MDRARTPAPGLISSLEAMIDASISSALERRLDLMDDPLNVQIEAAVDTALNRRLGINGLKLNEHIEKAVTNAIKRRFGCLGSVLNAQIVLGGPQSPFQQFAESSHEAAAQTTLETQSSTAHKIQKPSQIIGLGIELMGVGPETCPETSVENNNGIGAGETSLQQSEKTPSETPVSKMHELESQVKIESLRADRSPRRTLPAHASAHDYTVRSLESSSHAQSKDLEDIELGERELTDEAYQAEHSLSVQPHDLNAAADKDKREREAESTERTITQPHLDGHGHALTAKPSLTDEDGMKTRDGIPSNQGHTLQHGPNHITNEKIPGAISIAQREEDTVAKARLSPVDAVSPSNDPLHPGVAGFAVVVGESEDHHRPMQECKKGLSGNLSEADSACQTEATRANAVHNHSTLNDSGRPASAENEVSLFVEQGNGAAATSTTTSLPKRKAGTLKEPAEAVLGVDGNETVQKKKRTKFNPPGYTEGPQIKFLKVCSQLSARASRRGYPRVVDLESFTAESNKQSFTMADVVATILWNHNAETLAAFLDIQTKPTFNFVRKEGDKRRRNFGIERKEEDSKTRVLVGYHARSPGHLWYEYYEYTIEPSGRWEPIRHQTGTISSINSKKNIQEAAVALGSEVFQRKVWALEGGAEIVVN